MEIVKKTEEYQIIKKRNGRYGIRRADRKWVTGDEKVKILVAEGLVKAAPPRQAPEPEDSAEAAAESTEEAAVESEEASGEPAVEDESAQASDDETSEDQAGGDKTSEDEGGEKEGGGS